MKHINIISILILIAVSVVSIYNNNKLRKNNDALRNNIETLYDSVTHYKIANNLNAAEVTELQFSNKELLRLYNEDKVLIEQLTKAAK